MLSLAEIAARHTELGEPDLAHLRALRADWQLLADLSFSDLVLWLPTWSGSGWVAGGQIRPTTGPTVFADDVIGAFQPRGRRPLLDTALRQGRVEGGPPQHALAPAQAVPVRREDRVIAVIARHADPAFARTGRLERAYLEAYSALAQMVADGVFPATGPASRVGAGSPRVGDGLLILDVDGVVDFASPNALSAYRRLGLAADLVGARLASLTASLAPARGPVDEDLSVVASGRAARTTEVADRHAHVLLRSIPLVAAGERTGALVLVRDVTEVRRRERELVSKDATIREIHHRVKNNLQTVAALLRLQARRIPSPEARAALEEAVQRVGSIAIVHEALSMSPDEAVDFDAVADRVCAMVAELTPADARVVPRRTGSFGALAAETATPLAMALTELLQNAVEHGLGGRSRGEASLEIAARRSPGRLAVEVRDTGVGLPAGFDPGDSGRLGLQIVRTLVVGELGGSLEFAAREGGGTAVALEIPLPTEQEARPR